MNQNPISNWDCVRIPLYAGRSGGYNKSMRYYKSRAGVLSLVRENAKKGFRLPVVIYKFNSDSGGQYERVFDSDSDLANLYLCGALTLEQMIARIDL